MAEVVGLKELQKRLKNLTSAKAKSAQRKALREQAKIVLNSMKANVPVDTGNLKKSLALKVDRDRATGDFIAKVGPAKKTRKGSDGARVIAADGWYAHFVEYGTARGQRPQPFLRPAWDTKKKTVDADLRRELLRQIIRISRA